ncbi:histidinol-phosphatase [Reyranella sp. CPCC 100927]|uniref:histidinol-phosphatase n=1 Tax=Reyranella sp. CPCC 100927 TaxID=2599616 RepID=UPI0011B6AC87|nr:histidinol-phosphatase [Reyranella sp. CPCC 100927]TWT03074.1 histidinol-phosphatase [Reyranella sp. CPCC 100927]
MTSTTPVSVPDAFVALAHRLADAARPVVRRYFRTPVGIDDKDDDSPVTIADREAEVAMRAILGREVPEHGVWGEEHGSERLDAEWVWVLDPIDGTRAFITGMPVFGTLIGLLHRGRPVLGIIDQPILEERWLGVNGRRTTFNGTPVATRTCDALAKAYMYSTAPQMFAEDQAGSHRALADKVKLFRWGGDCYSYGLLASGCVDLVIESSLKLHDFCAVVPVIQGAGGLMTDWRGQPLDKDSEGHVIAAGDAAVHRAAQAILSGERHG